MRTIKTRADALREATEADRAAQGFANKRKAAKDAGLERRAREAADDAARMATYAREMRALADSL